MFPEKKYEKLPALSAKHVTPTEQIHARACRWTKMPPNNPCLNKNVHEQAIPREKSQLKYLGHIQEELLGKTVLS